MKCLVTLVALAAVAIAAPGQAQQPPLVDVPPEVIMTPPGGPAQRLPPPQGMPPGQVIVHGQPVWLRLVSQPPQKLTFHLNVAETYGTTVGFQFGFGGGYYGAGYGWGGYGAAPYVAESHSVTYRRICTGSCDISLLEGTHRFAVSLPGREPLNLQPLDLTSPSTISVRYVDRRRLRRIGFGVFLAATVVGMGLTFGGLNYDAFGGAVRNGGMFYSGVAIWTAGAISGLALMLQGDKAEVTVEPSASY